MPKTNQNFTVWKGDSKILQVAVTDVSGNIVNLTNFTATWNMYDGSTVITTKTLQNGISITNASGGILEITLTGQDTQNTGVYYHEGKVTDALNNTTTIFTGNITIQS